MKLLKPAWIHHGGNGKPIMSADIHPDGSRLATGGQGDNGGLIVLWNMEPVRSETAENDADVPKVLTRLQAHTGCVNCVRWSHSGTYLASCSDDRIVMIWQLVGRIVPVKQPNAGQNGDTKKSSQSAASAFGGASIETWRCAHSLTGHRGDVLHVDWSVRDDLLASASVDNTAIIWSVARGERLATLSAHSGFVKGISFDPIGKYVATQSDDRTLRVWRTSDWRCEAVVSAPFHDCDSTTHVLRLAWTADGRSIMSAHAMNNRFPVVQLIDRSDWRLSVDLVGHRKAVTVVRVLPLILRRTLSDAAAGGKDGEDNYEQCSAVGSRDRSISIWLNSLKRPLVVLHDLFTDSVLDLAWNVNRGTHSQPSATVHLELVATSYDGSIAFVSIDEHELVNRRVATRDATDAYLRSIYGSNVPAFRDCATFATANGHPDPAAQRARLIEHADVLELHSRSNNLQNDQRASVQAQPARQKETHSHPRPTEQCEIRTKDGRRRITPAFVANLLTTVEPITPTPTVRPAEQSETSLATTDKKHSEDASHAESDTNGDRSKSLASVSALPNTVSPSKTAMNAKSLADVFDEVIGDSIPKGASKDPNAATLTPLKTATNPDSGKPPPTVQKQLPAENDKDKDKDKTAATSASGTMKRKLADPNASAREREKDKERPPTKKPVLATVDAHEKPSHAHDHDARDTDRHVGAAVPTTPTLTPASTLADALLRAYLAAARLKSANSEAATCSFTVPIPVSSSSTTEANAAPSDSDIGRGTLGDQLLVETGARTCKLSRVAHVRTAEEQSDAQTQPVAARWSVLLEGRVVALAVDAAAQLVCAARADATLQLRELDSGALAALPILLDAVVSHVQFIDSRYLLAVTELGTVTMWRVVPDAGDAFSSPVFSLGSGCGLGACLNSTVSIQSLVCREPLVADLLRHAALRFASRVPLSVRVNDVTVAWSVRDERLLIARAAVTLNGAAMRTLAVFATDSRTLHAFSTDVVHIASFCNVSFLNAACAKLERPAVTFGNFDIIPLRSAFERCASYLDRFANDVPSASKDMRCAPGSFGEAVANEREHAAANRLRVVEELICFAKLSRDDASLKRWFALYVHCVVQSCADESDRAAQSLAAAFNKHVANCATANAGLLRFATDADRRRYATLLLGLIGANVHLQRLYQALKFTLDSTL